MTKSTIVMMLVLCNLAGALSAAEFYVSASGSDKNTGTKTSPFRTIQKAADIVQPGNTCIIERGVYREHVVLHKSGEPGNPIVFRAARPTTVTIDGTNPIDAVWQPYRETIYRVSLAHPTERLFFHRRAMTWARFLNMKFSENWVEDKKWARTDAGSGPGLVKCSALRPLGDLDLTGAYCFIKYGKGNNTWSRKITLWKPEEVLFEWNDEDFYDKAMTAEDGESAMPEDISDDTLNRLIGNEFFLRGSLALLDAEEEWLFDENSKTLYYPGWSMWSAAVATTC